MPKTFLGFFLVKVPSIDAPPTTNTLLQHLGGGATLFVIRLTSSESHYPFSNDGALHVSFR